MIDPSLPLAVAIRNLLLADAGVTALVADRVFDEVPGDAAKPYVALGEPQVLPDKAACLSGARVAFTLHAWAAGPRSIPIRELGAAILDALDSDDLGAPPADLNVAGHRVIACELEQAQYLNDPDPQTRHAVIVFIYTTEPA